MTYLLYVNGSTALLIFMFYTWGKQWERVGKWPSGFCQLII